MLLPNKANCRAGLSVLPALTLVLGVAVLVNFHNPALCAPQSKTSALSFVEPSQDDLLLVALKLDQNVLSSDLDGYMTRDGILLPLGEMCRLLEMGVTVNPSAGTAEGTLASPKHMFSLDVPKREASVDGKPVPVNPEMIQLHSNDIYVDTRQLTQWLPLDMTFSKSDAMISVHAREPLPMQLRLNREKNAGRALAAVGLQDNGYELVSNPYRMLGFSAVDQRLTLSTTAAGSGRESLMSYSTVAAGDLLGMGATAVLFNNGSTQSPMARLTLSKIDPGAELAGGLHARSLYLGDIYAPSQPLLFRSRPGRGFMISSYPINQQDQFDTHTFQGTILPGWDVELYRDDVLIGYAAATGDGRYEFKDVPLLFGLNTFKLLFYGPRGERREEERRFNVGRSLISPGQLYYRMALNGLDNDSARFVLQNDYGLRRDLSINTTVANLRVDGQDSDYASIGLRSCLGGVFLQSDSAFQRNGGSASEIALQTMVGNVSVGLHHTRLNDFTSEVYRPDADRLQSRTSLSLDGIRMPSKLHLSQMSVGVETEHYASGTKTTRLTDRISANIRGLRISHYMDYESSNLPGAGDQSIATRTLVISKRFGRTELRGEMRTGLSPASKLNDMLLSIERSLSRGRVITAGVMRSSETGQTSILASYNKSQGSYGMGYMARYDSGMGLTAGVNLFFGLGREPRTGAVYTDAASTAQSGAASLRAFLDTNQNGLLDSDEKAVEGVKFAVNSTIRDAMTDKNGIALLTGLQGYQPTDVSVVDSSLEDPLWVPEKKGYRMVPRAGNALVLDVPIVATGEISGTVRLNDKGSIREAQGVELEIVDQNGKVAMTARSEYDGFFLFSKVMPGKYTLRVAPNQVGYSQMTAADKAIDVPATGAYLDGVDIALNTIEIPAPTTTAGQPTPSPTDAVGGG